MIPGGRRPTARTLVGRAVAAAVVGALALAGPALAHGEESGTVHHGTLAVALFAAGVVVAGAGVVLDGRSDLSRRSVDALVLVGAGLALLALPALWL